MIPERETQIYIGRPWQHWAFGTFIFALLSMFFAMAVREGMPLLTWRAWPAYAVTAIFTPLALLMLSIPAISVRIDETKQEVMIIRHRLIGSGTAVRVSVAAVKSVDVRAIETDDGETYHVDIFDDGGERRTVTPHQIKSKKRAEAIAASIRARIDAARRSPA